MNRKYSFDENFFETQTDEFWYVLGLLYADATNSYICAEKYELRIELTDKELLIKLQKLIHSNHPLHLYKREKDGIVSTTWVLSLRSESVVRLLIDLGVRPRKTFTIEFPRNVGNESKRHLIRGIFDGDGSAYIAKRKTGMLLRTKISSASPKFLEKLAGILHEELGILSTVFVEKGKYYNVHYGTKDSIKLYHYLYDDSTIFLARKEAVFKYFFSIRGENIDLIKCQSCGTEFQRSSNCQKWCPICKPKVLREQSNRSKKKARVEQAQVRASRPKEYIECLQCGHLFEKTHWRKIYCGKACGDKAEEFQRRQRCAQRKKGRQIQCAICGHSFVVYKGGKHKYCSPECVRQGRLRAYARHRAKKKTMRVN